MNIIESFRLDGRVALVTGAGRGIGEGIALAYAEAGSDLALVARTHSELEGVAARVRGLGRRAVAVPADVGDVDGLPGIVARIAEAFGRIDILVNAAGIQRRMTVLEATPEGYDQVMNINLRGAYFLCQAVGRGMIERREGKIVNIVSMTTYRGFHMISPYGISKAGLANLTRYLAVEWAPHNVQANAIAPGWIETPMTARMGQPRRDWVLAHVPQAKFGSPRDVAALAVYLASPASDYMTGQVIALDGGFLAGNPWPTDR